MVGKLWDLVLQLYVKMIQQIDFFYVVPRAFWSVLDAHTEMEYMCKTVFIKVQRKTFCVRRC